MILTRLAEVVARSRRSRLLAALSVAVALLAAGCAPLAELGQRQIAPPGAGQAQVRQVTILYTGYSRGVVEPIVDTPGCT